MNIFLVIFFSIMVGVDLERGNWTWALIDGLAALLFVYFLAREED